MQPTSFSVADTSADAALRESEAPCRTAFEAIDVGLCIIELLFDDAGRPVHDRLDTFTLSLPAA